MDTQDRNISLSLLIKHRNRMSQRINQTQQDIDGVDMLVKTMRRSQFIQNARFNFYLYRFEPDEFIELVGAEEQS